MQFYEDFLLGNYIFIENEFWYPAQFLLYSFFPLLPHRFIILMCKLKLQSRPTGKILVLCCLFQCYSNFWVQRDLESELSINRNWDSSVSQNSLWETLGYIKLWQRHSKSFLLFLKSSFKGMHPRNHPTSLTVFIPVEYWTMIETAIIVCLA